MPSSIDRSRRDFIVRGARLAALLGVGAPLLQACGGGSSGKAVKDPIDDGLEPEQGPLRIINYADYVNPDVIAAFEKEYGVKVEITTINSGAEMTAKITSGSLKADLSHSLAPTNISRLIAGGILQPLNKSYVPNAKNIVDAFNNPSYDPGALYTMPYTFYGTGIGYRRDRLDPATIDEMGFDSLWEATGVKGQVSILDDEREAFAASMIRRGQLDINTLDQRLIDEALADVTTLIDLQNVKVNIEGYKDIPEGNTSLALTWSADLITGQYYLPEGTEVDVLGFWRPPTDRYVIANDAMAVLAGAEHPVLAHHYLNYILDETNSETNFSWVGYLPALKKLDADYVIAGGYVPEHLRNCVPTNDDIANGLHWNDLGAEGDLQYEEAWSKFTAAG